MDLGGFGVEDVHRIAAAGNAEDGRVVKVLRELLSIKRSTGDEQLQIWPEARNVLHLSPQRQFSTLRDTPSHG